MARAASNPAAVCMGSKRFELRRNLMFGRAAVRIHPHRSSAGRVRPLRPDRPNQSLAATISTVRNGRCDVVSWRCQPQEPAMKSNPSRRQSSTSYLDTLRSELDALTQQLQEAEAAASTAQQEADSKRRAYHELEQRSNSTHWSVTEQRLFREKNHLEAVARQLQQDLVPLREEHARMKRKVQAPAQLETARIEMAALTDRRTALAQEINKATTLL